MTVRTRLLTLLPPQIAGLLAATSFGLQLLLPAEYRHQFSCFSLGVSAVVVGTTIMTWALLIFLFRGVPIRPTSGPAALVTAGPFRFTRNPMYLGGVTSLLGMAVWVGSFPMLIAPIGFFLIMSRVFIPYEEQRLRQTFGDAYIAYTQKVRRWL